MKEARKVDLTEGQELSWEQYDELATHARNSMMWYTSNYAKTSKELREKLYKKGYPKGEVKVTRWDGTKQEVNIVDETIQWLIDSLIIDDELFAERFAESKKRQKQGRSRVRMALIVKGLDPEMVEPILEKVYSDSDEELRAYLERELGYLRRRDTDPWKIRQKLFQKAAGRGWDLDQVGNVLGEVLAEDDF